MNNKNLNQTDRRQFLKAAGAFGMLSAIGKAGSSTSSSQVSVPKEGFVIPSCVDTDIREYHICMGLNMKTVKDESGTSYAPGTAPGPTLKVKEDMHECMGGNTCAGLGGCGTGTYERQYWVGDNICARSSAADWTGSGGCGVPIGHGNSGFLTTQLNGGTPTSCAKLNDAKEAECYDDKGKPMDSCSNYSSEFLAQPVWNIARARFEAKMLLNASEDKAHATKYAFGVPKGFEQGLLKAGTLTVDKETNDCTYTPPADAIPPYPLPIPPRCTAEKKSVLQKCDAASKVNSSVSNPQ